MDADVLHLACGLEARPHAPLALTHPYERDVALIACFGNNASRTSVHGSAPYGKALDAHRPEAGDADALMHIGIRQSMIHEPIRSSSITKRCG
jgi:hypothetical protein